MDADILKKIELARNEYYTENQKNTFFKKQQKFDCAETITNNIDIDKFHDYNTFRAFWNS